jgi:hypothetical protein
MDVAFVKAVKLPVAQQRAAEEAERKANQAEADRYNANNSRHAKLEYDNRRAEIDRQCNERYANQRRLREAHIEREKRRIARDQEEIRQEEQRYDCREKGRSEEHSRK